MPNDNFENSLTFKITLRAMLMHTWPFSKIGRESKIEDPVFIQVKLTPWKIFMIWIKSRVC
jgi:hypothetical protein